MTIIYKKYMFIKSSKNLWREMVQQGDRLQMQTRSNGNLLYEIAHNQKGDNE